MDEDKEVKDKDKVVEDEDEEIKDENKKVEDKNKVNSMSRQSTLSRGFSDF